jgi:hypothetical protein
MFIGAGVLLLDRDRAIRVAPTRAGMDVLPSRKHWVKLGCHAFGRAGRALRSTWHISWSPEAWGSSGTT